MTQIVFAIVIGSVALAITIIAVFWALNLSNSVHSVVAAVARLEAAQAEDDAEAADVACAEGEGVKTPKATPASAPGPAPAAAPTPVPAPSAAATPATPAIDIDQFVE